MKEIKFRGKRVDNDEWVYGYYVFYGHMGVFKHLILTNWAQVYANSFVVESKTVGQYTGLKDKHGKEIYEGDIIKYFPNVIGFVYFDEKETAFKFKEETQKRIIYKDYASKFEVIGNIYENKDLLEVE